MIVYFADRKMNILGFASTNMHSGLSIVDDKKTEQIESGVVTFECRIPWTNGTREQVEAFTEAGNYILRSNENENEFYTIIDCEIDTSNRDVYVYAEDAGMDILNEIVPAYTAPSAQNIEYYINKYLTDSGFEIGVNNYGTTTKKILSWDGESTAAERLASIATQFDGCEISFSFDIKNLSITGKYINIYDKRGNDIGQPLMLNREIDRIITKKSVANLCTALYCTGKDITLNGAVYDDGDFYVDGAYLKSRNALEKWSRYKWEAHDTTGDGHVVGQFNYDTSNKNVLLGRAKARLKEICDTEINYDVDISILPENVRVGDRIRIVDEDGELFVEARVLILERSICNDTINATLGEFIILDSGISENVTNWTKTLACTISITSSAGLIFNNADITTTLTAHVFYNGRELSTATEPAISDIGQVNWYNASGNLVSEDSMTYDVGSANETETYVAKFERS